MEDTLEKTSQTEILSHIDNPRDKALLKLVLDTGLYVNELVNLYVHSIDWTNHILHIEGKRQRQEPLEAATMQLLTNWVEQRPKTDKPFLFLTLKGDIDQLSSRGVDRILRKWGERAQIEALNFRTLRNTYKEEAETQKAKNTTTQASVNKEPKDDLNEASTKEAPIAKKQSSPKAILLVILLIGFVFNFLFKQFLSDDDED